MPDHKRTSEIEELHKRLSALEEEQKDAISKARKNAEKRDVLNQQTKSLHAEIGEMRKKRDEMNANVQELKQLRLQSKSMMHNGIDEIKRTGQEIRTLTMKTSRDFRNVKREFDSLEWKIQTTSFSLQEEKEIIQRVKELEAELSVHTKIAELDQRRLELKTEIKTFDAKSELSHKRLMETAEESQQIHEQMLKKAAKTHEIKSKADRLHKNLVQARSRSKQLQKEISEVLKELAILNEEDRKETDKKRKRREKTLLQELEKRAEEKMKRGEKLTWDEFQVLTKKRIGTQD